MRKTWVGKKYGRLFTLEETRRGIHLCYKCRCDCGNTLVVRSSQLATRHTQSCGCLKKEMMVARNTIHGCCIRKNRTPAYDTWANMIQRCHNPKTKRFQNYGGRGITVCEKWRISFADFLNDMGNPPSDRHSIERLDNDKGYFKSNCVWATDEEQANNKRTNRFITFRKQTKTVAQWTRELGFKTHLIRDRLRYRWPLELAMSLPPTGKRLKNILKEAS